MILCARPRSRWLVRSPKIAPRRQNSPALQRARWRKGWGTDLRHLRCCLKECGVDEKAFVHHTRVTVRQHWPAILRVAAALQERGMLSGSEIEGLIRDG
jgi:hypothetical protein